jgi:lysozyme family protein
MLRLFRPRYEKLSKDLGIPWYFVGVVHALEASFNFRSHLHNGDPLTSRTVQVPAGRPPDWLPPSDWESSAKDALMMSGLAGKHDWGLENMLYRWEAYNGFGYRPQKVNSPYLWSFSSNYAAGKFVKDGKWDASAKSQQCGAVVMLKALINANDVEKL